jgi:hypothetical protein
LRAKAGANAASIWTPQHSTCEHRQGVAQVNHLIESGAEKIVGDHQNFPQFLSGFHVYYFNFSEISACEFPVKPFCSCALPRFFRADAVWGMAWLDDLRHQNPARFSVNFFRQNSLAPRGNLLTYRVAGIANRLIPVYPGCPMDHILAKRIKALLRFGRPKYFNGN